VALRYKFVEVATVTAAALEAEVNRWVGEGWHLDAIRFVTGEAAKRPKLAFVSFVRDDEVEREVEVELPVVSTIRRKTKIIELGELDLGEVEPFEAVLDWEAARTKKKVKGKDKGKGRR